MVLLVALRVAIGWHFFQEGVSHRNDPKWSSEPFLRQAKGPLADQYKSRAPGYHEFDLLLAVPLEDEPAPEGEAAKKPQKGAESNVYREWYTAVVRDWKNRGDEISNLYHFTDEQKEKLKAVLDQYDQNLTDLLALYETDITNYRRQLARNQAMAKVAGADAIPNLQARATKRERDPLVEPATFSDTKPSEWISNIKDLEAAFEREVLGLRTAEQTEKYGAVSPATTPLKQMDTTITWVLIVGGGCLLVGLFTRLSAVVLAIFLGSVIASQPPWVAGTAPTYFQVVELIALVVLASSHVGRWGGLDFFVHHFITRPLCRTKNNA